MNSEKVLNKTHKIVFSFVLAGSSAILLSYLVRRLTDHSEYLLDFRWNIFSITNFICIAVLLAVVFMLVRIKLGGRVLMWYTFHILAMLIWVIGFTLASLSADVQGFLFWYKVGAIGLVMMPPLFYIFTIAYTKNDNFLYKWSTLGGLLFFATLVNVFYATAPIGTAASESVTRQPWGLAVPMLTFLGPAFILYVQILYLAALFILIKYLFACRDEIVKKQVISFIIAGYVPFIGTTLFDVVMPLFGINFIPTINFWLTVLVVGIAFSIKKYGLFHYDAAALSGVIVDSAAEGIMVVDREGRVVQLNDAGRKMLDLKAMGNIEGKIWSSLFDAYIGDKLVTQNDSEYYVNLSNHQRLEFLLNDDVHYETHTGKKFPVSVTMTPVEEAVGGGSVIIFRDITKDKKTTQIIEQKVKQRTSELHKTQAQLVASVNSLKQGYVMTDQHANVLTMNWAASMMFCPEEHGDDSHATTCSMKDIMEALHGTLDIKSKIETVIHSKKPKEIEDVAMKNKFLYIYISPIFMDDKTIGTTILVEDVTEARILDRSKDEFFSIASHELRTPLTAIRGNAKMIDEFYAAELKDESLKNMVHDIYESSVRLIELVNDFLDVSRLEQGKIKYAIQPFMLDKVIESVVYEMSAVAQQRKLNLTMDKVKLGELPPVYADKDRVKQVVYNLVGNALKFTTEGEISIGVLAQKHSVKVTITDTGPGISPEGKRLLFRKFQQAGESLLTRNTTKGTGLGLYISKLLVEAMGGSVVLEKSELGVGTEFSFTLPFATQSQLDRQPASKDKGSSDTGSAMRESLVASLASESSTPNQ